MDCISTRLLEQALAYAAEGLLVFPLHNAAAGKCSCGRSCSVKRQGKHPRIRSDWQKAATTDKDQIRRWWKKWPSANIAILTGTRSGLVVVDFDDDPKAKELLKFCLHDERLNQTRIIKTGSGGAHIYFRHPGTEVGNRTRMLPGIDLRGDGGYVVAPPSSHGSGNLYSIDRDGRISDLPLYETFAEITADFDVLQGVARGTRSDEGETRSDQRETTNDEAIVKRVADAANNRAFDFCFENATAEQKRFILEAIENSIPREAGVRNRQTFELARRLQGISEVPWSDVDVDMLRPVVRRWYEMSQKTAQDKGFQIHGDFAETWRDFRYGWTRVEIPFGDPLAEAVANIKSRCGKPLPLVFNAIETLQYQSSPAICGLTMLAFELNLMANAGEFLLASRAAARSVGELLNTTEGKPDHMWAYRALHQLVDDGVIECTELGQQGAAGRRKSAKWRWIWTERPARKAFNWL